MLLAFSAMAWASDEAVVDENVAGILVKNGVATPMTQTEVNAFLIESERHREKVLQMENLLLKENDYLNEDIIAAARAYKYTYRQSSSSTVYGTPFPVSAWLVIPNNGGRITASMYQSVTKSFSAGLSSEAMGFIFNYVKANVNASIATSTTNSVSYSVNGEPGRTQRLMFKPLMQRSTGTLQTYLLGGHSEILQSTTNVTSEHSIMYGGFADGAYYLVNK